MNRQSAPALSTDRIFPWPDRFRVAIAPFIRKTNHAADL